jgi:translation initiation factor 4G
METVKKAAQTTDSDAKVEIDATSAADAKAKADDNVKANAQAAEEAKIKEESEAKAAAEKAKQEEEDELERQIQEMEEAEREREKKEQELLEKRAAERKVTEAAEAEKRKASAAEEDAKLREQEREMERLEDERERKRAEAEAKAQGGDKVDETASKVEGKGTPTDDKTGPATPNTVALKLFNLNLGGDSGASTPASDDSMPPPPKVSAAEKRGKPAALKLEPLNTKRVDPPQPSAALQSLKSARFLRVIDSSIYPSNISSPNPALNSAVTTKGKSFKYDKEFLLQFQKVFVEKPSLEFESQIKALIGDPSDGGSARSASTRTNPGMGPRGSNRQPPGASAMGTFGAGGIAAKTLPPGTTSAERFAMSQGAMARPPINPMASFNRPGGAFPGGSSMARTPSSSAMNSMPHSPRQPSKSQRGSKRDNYQGNAKQEAQAAKTMPLTAGMELKPIQVSATGWKPRSIGANQSATGAAGPAPGASGVSGHMEPEMVQRKVKAALNKMTPEKFDKIADQILTIAAQSKDEADGRTLRQVIQLTFEKATDEAHWAGMYAKFCKRMLETMSPEIKDESILDKNGNIVSGGNLFRKYLLNRCQEEFERGWKMDLPDKPEGERGEEKTEEAVMLSDEYYIAAAAKRRGLGLVQFIGELYKLSMLTERIMHECVKKLVDYTGIPDEAEIESLTKLLKTIGSNLDSTEKGKPMMDVYFSRIQGMMDQPDLPSRLRFMLMDIVDLRKKHWQSKEDNKGPKTLEQVRAEVC